MTVAEVIVKIGRARSTIESLTRIAEKYDMTYSEENTIVDAIDSIDSYIFELESKNVQ